MASVYMLYTALFTHILCLSRRKGAVRKGRSQPLYGRQWPVREDWMRTRTSLVRSPGLAVKWLGSALLLPLKAECSGNSVFLFLTEELPGVLVGTYPHGAALLPLSVCCLAGGRHPLPRKGQNILRDCSPRRFQGKAGGWEPIFKLTGWWEKGVTPAHHLVKKLDVALQGILHKA